MTIDHLPLFHCRYIGQTLLTNQIIELRLEHPEGFTWQAGDYVWLGAEDLVFKPFSFANTPNKQEIHLQLVLTPQNQAWLDALSNHHALSIRGPVTQYHWSVGNEPMVLLAGGTGITPFMNLLLAHEDQLSSRSVTLYWGVKTQADAYLHEQLDRFQQTYPQFRWQLIVSQPENESSRIPQGLLPDVISTLIPALDPNTQVLICGPWGMVTACKTWASTMGIDDTQVQS